MILDGYIARIKLKNDEIIDLSLSGPLGDRPNYITDMSVIETEYTESNSPVGVLTSNTFEVSLVSLDRSLIPENKNSPYFGYMDATAKLEVGVIIDGEEVSFGYQYINNWSSSATSDDKYGIRIESSDIISTLIKSVLPDIDIEINIDMVDVLNRLADKINTTYNRNIKFEYNGKGKYSLLNNNDIDASNIGDYLNTIAMSCLVNMYTDRTMDDTVKVIDCDSSDESDITLSDKVEVEYASIESGSLVGYSGVKVGYSLFSVNKSNELTSLKGINLIPGENNINDIKIGPGVYKLLYVSIIDSGENTESVTIDDIKYNSNTANLKITNSNTENVAVDIVIYGQKLTENNLYKLKGDDSDLVYVENKLVNINNINRYTDDLYSLLNNRAKSVVVEGSFDPRKIRLNSKVFLDCNDSIYIDGEYKIKELQWQIGDRLECKATLIK